MSASHIALRAADLELPAGSVYWVTWVADWAAERVAPGIDLAAMIDDELRAEVVAGVRDHHRLAIPPTAVTLTTATSDALVAAYDELVLHDARLFAQAHPPWLGDYAARIGWWTPPGAYTESLRAVARLAEDANARQDPPS